jgi:hypothetical protein
MELNIASELGVLQRLTVKQLRERYAEAFGEATRGNYRDWLIKRIAWRLQALAEGDLSDRARRRAEELANDAELRVIAPKDVQEATVPMARRRTETTALAQRGDDRLPPPGSVIVREYKGESLRSRCLPAALNMKARSTRRFPRSPRPSPVTPTGSFSSSSANMEANSEPAHALSFWPWLRSDRRANGEFFGGGRIACICPWPAARLGTLLGVMDSSKISGKRFEG